ncbi:NnrS family protein [Mesorhizobium sp. B2-4-11]|uniref:NnrS family protein n=1 Tax=Mesorhizobium sp. B2-4-11 TaxID=2589938 RepID=UPI00112AA410|nr:NnrS family protein [Mesorhizobium sp. B2-4-11]TPL12953.1 NnrS family protein [Mesorhizobium sp. B2-4-11]
MAADGSVLIFDAKQRRMSAPFRPFFLIAGLDAIVGPAVWLPSTFGIQAIGPTGISPGDWHRDVLLFGMVPAILTGFLLTALPRWTGRRAVSPLTTRLLVALWLCSRGTFLFLSHSAGLALYAFLVLTLLLIAAGRVIASRDRRNLKILFLLLAFCGGNILAAASYQVEFALRLALASIVGLVMIIGGRVVPALTVAYVESAGGRISVNRSAVLEYAAAAIAACALGLWVVAPQAQLTGVACALAACGQTMRAAQWNGWRSAASATALALHIGYGWIIVGFGLLAIHILAPEWLGQAAAVHAWTIGAIGTMALPIMASMIRKHSHRAFASSAPTTGAFIAMTTCCLSRLLVELLPDYGTGLTNLSGAMWVVAFGLFVTAFRRMLILRKTKPDCRSTS